MVELILFEINNKNNIKKYNIFDKDNNIIKIKACNVKTPFGREINKFNSKQHRLNIAYKRSEENDLSLIQIIKDLENYFKDFEELKNFNLNSNIIETKDNIIIRFHLKTCNNKTTTTLVHSNKNYNVEWIDYDSTKLSNFEITPDCFWINHKNNTYGISLLIIHVFQFIN